MGTSIFGIGLSGLNAAQAGLTTTGHNIANVNTPGYTRQQLVQSARAPQFTGAGYFGQTARIAADHGRGPPVPRHALANHRRADRRSRSRRGVAGRARFLGRVSDEKANGGRRAGADRKLCAARRGGYFFSRMALASSAVRSTTGSTSAAVSFLA